MGRADEILVWMALAGVVGLLTGLVLGWLSGWSAGRRTRPSRHIDRWASTPSVDADDAAPLRAPAVPAPEAVLALEAGGHGPVPEPVKKEKRRSRRRRRRAEEIQEPVAPPPVPAPVAPVAVQRVRRDAPVVTMSRPPQVVEPDRLRPSESRAWRRHEPHPDPPPYEFETLRVREEPLQAWTQGWDATPPGDDENDRGPESGSGEERKPPLAHVAPARTGTLEAPSTRDGERPAELEPPALGFHAPGSAFDPRTGFDEDDHHDLEPARTGLETADEWEIEDIQGIGPAYARRLRQAGVTSIRDLLEVGASLKGRRELSIESGIRRSLVLRLVNQADLLRVEGVTPLLAELLETVGVSSPSELARRNVANLVSALADANQRRKIAPATPDEAELERIVAGAHALRRIVSR